MLARGCEAAGYRLAGVSLDHVCCRHLYGTDRLLTVWRGDDDAVVLLVGHHDRRALDVYDLLLGALGLELSAEQRMKPPCCGPDESPPVDQQLVASITAAVESLARRGPPRHGIPRS